jgi:hypothetical protein
MLVVARRAADPKARERGLPRLHRSGVAVAARARARRSQALGAVLGLSKAVGAGRACQLGGGAMLTAERGDRFFLSLTSACASRGKSATRLGNIHVSASQNEWPW